MVSLVVRSFTRTPTEAVVSSRHHRIWHEREQHDAGTVRLSGLRDARRQGNLRLGAHSAASPWGDCTYTLNATPAADISGDIIQGMICHTAATNDNPDRTDLEGCI